MQLCILFVAWWLLCFNSRVFHQTLSRIATGRQTAPIRQAVMKILLCNDKKVVTSGYKISCSIFFLTLFILIVQVSAAAETRLQIEDCGKCHAFQLRVISQDGGKHATEVGCLDCHPQHPDHRLCPLPCGTAALRNRRLPTLPCKPA